MEKYRIGDFIILNNKHSYIYDHPFCKKITVFKIKTISKSYAEVESCKKIVPFCDIEPISISDVYQNICYDSGRIPMGSLINDSCEKPIISTDTSCYYENDEIQKLIKSNKFNFVHELQHLLIDNSLGKLWIND